MYRYLSLLLLCLLTTWAQGANESPLSIHVLGDSYVRNHRCPYEETWHYQAAKQLGMTYHNYGRNGSSIAFDRSREGFGPAMCERYVQMSDTADIVLVIAGHNDAYFVTRSEDTLSLFRQRLEQMCLGLRHRYPRAIIAFTTPWDVDHPGFPVVITELRRVCRKHGFPLLDAAADSTIRVRDAHFRQQYFQGGNDHAHLNAQGHRLFLEQRGLDFMRSLAEQARAVQQQTTGYVFSYFDTKKQAAGLCIAWSLDGYHWQAINGNRPVMAPTVGNDRLLRDPSICLGPDGTFHMVFTSSWKDRIIGYASSRDLIHWSKQDTIPVMVDYPTCRNSWAPELYYDARHRLYYIYWASTVDGAKGISTDGCLSENGSNHRIYYCTTRDFRHFSRTRLYYNPPFNAIDAAIVRDPQTGELIMAVKNENLTPPEKNIRIARGRSMRRGFSTQVSAPIHGRERCEGPSPLFIGNDLIVYYDMYSRHQYGASLSHDHGYTWEDVTDRILVPQGMSHGTAIQVPMHVIDTLIEYDRAREQ